MIQFSRNNPSPDYIELVALYGQMHAKGFVRDIVGQEEFTDADHAFPGQNLHPWLQHIASLVYLTGSKSVLDYGSGKGLQYASDVRVGSDVLASSIKDFWNIEEIVCFDPGVPELNAIPTRQFDAVIATDVLEHVPESDVFWVVDELFSFADKFVFASIPCYRAAAILPDGRNAHITLRSPLWWFGVFQSAKSRWPGVEFSTVYLIPVKGQDEKKKVEYLHSFGSVDINFTMLKDPE